MPTVKVGSSFVKFGGGRIGDPASPAPSVDVNITFARTSPIRAAADRFHLGVTPTHDTFPGGAVSSAIAAAKALMVAVDWDFVNVHNHHFGQNGPWTNEDKNAGKTYADRATWTGWTAWDARLDHFRDFMGPSTKIIVSLLPPGWMKMDGGTYNAASDPLGLGRNWENLDNEAETRHTDAHRSDMVDLAKAIALRHSDVEYFSCFNEQKGNFTPSSRPTEVSSDGLSNIMNYKEQERYQEALRAGLDAVGKTAVEIMGPYHVLEANGVDTLAATYAGEGFPQPHAGAADADNYRQYYATGVPLMGRNETFYEYFLANIPSSARDNWLAVDWKLLGADNDSGNWNTLYPWRWYLFEGFRAQIQATKALAGIGTSRIIAMESYTWKVADAAHVSSDAEQGALAAEELRIQLEEGVHTVLRWAPEHKETGYNRQNLFTSTTDSLANGGGVALPAYTAYKLFADYFRGVNVYACTSEDWRQVTAVASDTHTLLINHDPNPKTVSINGGAAITLSGHEVKVVEE